MMKQQWPSLLLVCALLAPTTAVADQKGTEKQRRDRAEQRDRVSNPGPNRNQRSGAGKGDVNGPNERGWERSKDQKELEKDRRKADRERAKDRRKAEKERVKEQREAQRELDKNRREAARESEKNRREAYRESEKNRREADKARRDGSRPNPRTSSPPPNR